MPGSTSHDGVVPLVLDDATIARIEASAREQGCTVFKVDLSGAPDKETLLDRTAAGLEFPAWFGHNWDAWFDCLTDLGWIARAPGYVVLLLHAGELRQAAPEVFDTALAIAEDAVQVWASRGVRFQVFVDVESAD
jgi:hypothetical protein